MQGPLAEGNPVGRDSLPCAAPGCAERRSVRSRRTRAAVAGRASLKGELQPASRTDDQEQEQESRHKCVTVSPKDSLVGRTAS